MRTDTARAIRRVAVPDKGLAVFWLGQAGFVFKTHEGRVIYLDPYLTESVERLVGFKRLMPAVVAPEEARADAVLVTHHHEDHLDVDALPVIARRTRARFVAPAQSVKKLVGLGIDRGRISEVHPGSAASLGFCTAHAVYADHGEMAPDAIGFVLDFGFTRVYVTGDTAYRPERMAAAAAMKPQVIIPVINGAYGNLGSREAAALTRDTGARVCIPCHFWTFVEHGGDPAAFLAASRETAPDARVVLLAQGGCYTHLS